MNVNKKVSVDTEALENAQHTWGAFVKFTKVSTVLVIATLIVLAATLINWS